MKRLILMVQFLTRIPINTNLDVDVDDFTKGIIYFPVVGIVIGLILAAVLYLSQMIFSSIMPVAIVLVVAEIFATGGLHLDGLADTFDGVYSNRSKERVLEIMKDSRIGSNGVLALIILILLKTALLAEIGTGTMLYAVILMPIFSRGMIPLICYKANYPRKEGMGNMFIGKVSIYQVIIALFIVAVCSLIYVKSLIALPVMMIYVLMYRNHITKIIDGITGDILGASIEIGEMVFLITFILITKFVG